MAALSILAMKFVAVGLSKELAGNYNSAYGYLQLFGILADFGLYAVAVREVSAAKDRERVLGSLIILRSLILCLSLGAALAFVWLLPAWRGTPLPPSVTVAALVPFFTLLAGILRTIFQVEYKMHFVFVAEVIQRIITTALIGTFVVMGVRGSTDLRVLYAFLLIGGVGALVLFLLSLAYGNRLVRIRPRWDPALIRSLLHKALPYGIAFLCVALYRQFDVSLIALLRPDYEIQNAEYGFVQRAMDMAYLFPTFLLNSTLPMLAGRDARDENTRDFVGGLLFLVLLLGITAFLFAFLWARPLMQLLTTDAYLSTPDRPGSDSALSILSVSMFMNSFVTFSFYSLLARHAWRPLVRCLLIGVVASLALNFWLIPSWGFVGASISSAVVHSLLAALLLPRALAAMPVRIGAKRWRSAVVFAVLLGAFVTLMRPYLNDPVITVAALAVGAAWLCIAAWIAGVHNVALGDKLG